MNANRNANPVSGVESGAGKVPCLLCDKLIAKRAYENHIGECDGRAAKRLTWNQREVLAKIARGEEPSNLYTRAINSLKRRGIVYRDDAYRLQIRECAR